MRPRCSFIEGRALQSSRGVGGDSVRRTLALAVVEWPSAIGFDEELSGYAAARQSYRW